MLMSTRCSREPFMQAVRRCRLRDGQALCMQALQNCPIGEPCVCEMGWVNICVPPVWASNLRARNLDP
jgi:hypothetical protein